MEQEMIWWIALLVAALFSFGIKLAGHLVPEKWLAHPAVRRTADLLTVCLLAALVAKQTLTSGSTVALDARVPAVAVAALLLWRKAPFIVVVAVAAGVAAGLRALGWG